MPDVQILREIHPSARIASDAQIGPYCVIGPDVTIGPGTRLVRRVSIQGMTSLGSNNVLCEGVILGALPQDLKYQGHETLLQIGHNNRFDRYSTAHIGTEMGGWLTRIGDGNHLREGSHIAHDCFVCDRTTIGRNVLLGGHIRVETGSVVGDLAGVHHFVTIGRYARVQSRTPVRRDVPPYTLFGTAGDSTAPPAVLGIHEEGIDAADLPAAEARELRWALRELFAEESALQTKIEHLVNMGAEGEVAACCEFCQRSLQGQYGRHRAAYRGEIPPEARRYLPAEYLRLATTALELKKGTP
jgi:UDP-N-acetylglucosamine acyltransferase